jgi:hypothetical protein
MEQDLKEAKTPAVLDQETQVRQETHQLKRKDFGQVERGVRALIGVPVALSSIYARHSSLTASLSLGAVGLYLVGTTVFRYCPIRHLIYWARWKQSSF